MSESSVPNDAPGAPAPALEEQVPPRRSARIAAKLEAAAAKVPKLEQATVSNEDAEEPNGIPATEEKCQGQGHEEDAGQQEVEEASAEPALGELESAMSELNVTPSTSAGAAANGTINHAARRSFAVPGSALLRNFDPSSCTFCSIPLKAQEGIMIFECLHIFCQDCLQSAIETQVDAIRVPCPLSPNCPAFLSDAEVKCLVSPAIFQNYVDRSLALAKREFAHVFQCLTPLCPGWCEFEEGRKTFTCPVCEKSHCLSCRALHSGVDCATYQRLASAGQLDKLQETVEKEAGNTGWGQLAAMVGAGGDGLIPKIMADLDLLENPLEFECPICFTDVEAGDGVILHECLHLFCKTCLIGLVEHNESPTVKCPHMDANYSCVSNLQAREIRKLVPALLYEKHLQRSMQLGESSIQNSFHCKTPDCRGWCVYEVGDPIRFVCPVCHESNCITCNAIHEDSCEDFKNRMVQNANDKLSEEAVETMITEGKAMRCPKCRIPVEKTAGCDWLQCTACRTELCWVTKGPRWGPKGLGDISGGCRCKVNGNRCHPQCGNCH